MKSIGYSVVALLLTGATLAAEPASDAVRRCMSQTDTLARLNCYDRLYGTLPATAGTPAPAATTAPAATPAPAVAAAGAAAATTVAAPTFGGESLAKTREAKVAAIETSLTAQVSEMKEIRDATYRISLANGQVWMQEEMKSSFRLDVGDTVQIERGKIGGYTLARVTDGKPRGTWIRVKRYE